MTPRHAVAVASLSLAMLGLGGPPPHEPDVAFEGLPDEIELVEADDGQPARFDGEVVVRLFIRDAADLMLVGQLSSDAWTHGPEIGAWSDWRLGRSDLDALRAARIDFEVIPGPAVDGAGGA